MIEGAAMKVLFVAQNLNIGGVQIALKNTCNTLVSARKEIELDIFTFSEGALKEYFDKRIGIKKGKKLLNLLLTPIFEIKKTGRKIDLFLRYLLVMAAKVVGVKKLYSFLFSFEKIGKEYDVAISYFNDVPGGYSNKGTNWYVDKFVKAGKKVAWVHTDPEKAKFNREECLETYSGFDKIACVSDATREKFNIFLPEYKEKTCTVYNVFEIEDIKKKAEEERPEYSEDVFNIVTVGRVDNSTKRMDRIVEVCCKLKSSGVNTFKWRVVGDGPDFHKNTEYAKELCVTDVLEFVGAKTNPYPYIKNSDLFVLSSDYEGYPMVLGESLILGVPIVTTAFAAAKEMITVGENGYIVDMDIQELFDVIYGLIIEKEKYELLSENIKQNVFTNALWEEQMEQVL